MRELELLRESSHHKQNLNGQLALYGNHTLDLMAGYIQGWEPVESDNGLCSFIWHGAPMTGGYPVTDVSWHPTKMICQAHQLMCSATCRDLKFTAEIADGRWCYSLLRRTDAWGIFETIAYQASSHCESQERAITILSIYAYLLIERMAK